MAHVRPSGNNGLAGTMQAIAHALPPRLAAILGELTVEEATNRLFLKAVRSVVAGFVSLGSVQVVQGGRAPLACDEQPHDVDGDDVTDGSAKGRKGRSKRSKKADVNEEGQGGRAVAGHDDGGKEKAGNEAPNDTLAGIFGGSVCGGEDEVDERTDGGSGMTSDEGDGWHDVIVEKLERKLKSAVEGARAQMKSRAQQRLNALRRERERLDPTLGGEHDDMHSGEGTGADRGHAADANAGALAGEGTTAEEGWEAYEGDVDGADGHGGFSDGRRTFLLRYALYGRIV